MGEPLIGQIRLLLRAGDRPASHVWGATYGVAGQEVVTPEPLPVLEPFRIAAHPEPPTSPVPPAMARPESCRLWFEGEVAMAGSRREMRSWADSTGYRIEVEGLPPFGVARDGSVITCDAAGEVGRSHSFAEVFLGPALTVALALKGIFCLHASALRRGDRAVAFTGESGAGKSTLAREVDLATAGRWAWLSDDALPIVVQGASVEVDAHFPQLKLDPGEQLTPDRQGRFPLAAIVVVEPSRAAAVQLERSGPAESLLAVASQTVAARLFDRELLARHLAFSRDVARLIPVFRLTYPHRASAIAEVVAILDRLVDPDRQQGART